MEVAYITRFRAVPQVVVHSPGRMNLIGEHTDYNFGFAFPAAIDKAITISVGLMGGGNSTWDEIYAVDRKQFAKLDSRQGNKPQQAWTNYIGGVLDGLGLVGVRRPGFRCCFGGDIPIGAGLSSSAALSVGLGLALSELYDLPWSRLDIAHIAQRAEHEFVGVNCGLMDAYASLFGRQGHFMKLDCRDLSCEYVPADLGDYAILLCDSRMKHALASTAFNRRHAECQIALEVLQAQYPSCRSLRDVEKEMLVQLRPHVSLEVYKRCKYVIEENERVRLAAAAFEVCDIATVGDCLYHAHEGMQYDYDVTCRETDFLVDFTRPLPYVAGARQMGGGFGGCTINLILKTEIPAFKERLTPQYQARFGKAPYFYEVKTSDGGHYLKH